VQSPHTETFSADAPGPGYPVALPHHEHIAGLVERLRQGDARALARAISLVENEAAEAPALLSACYAHTGHARRIGITGAPGAGKSTLADRLAQQFRHADRTVGLLAVDPTSPFTGGALLGDRIRLREHASDPGFYCRSMATRGALGGLALATADAAMVLEAAGKDVVLVETVGVGQDEVEIARLADVTLVVLVPGMGDDVQSLKAGLMEVADLYVINKADREGADRVEQEIKAMQSLAPEHRDWIPPVVRTVATTGAGIDHLMEAMARMETWLTAGNRLAERRARHWQRRLEAMLRAELMRRARSNGLTEGNLHQHAERIAAGEEDPWRLVRDLAKSIS
jgi:LAO/AO transport system kinase